MFVESATISAWAGGGDAQVKRKFLKTLRNKFFWPSQLYMTCLHILNSYGISIFTH
jgi:hypothetical protein